MPELPEVETIRRSLEPLIGRRVEKVLFSRLAPVETTTPAKIRRTLRGTTITAIRRWGKYLLIDTDRGASLVIHLGMSGSLTLAQPGEGSSRKLSRTCLSPTAKESDFAAGILGPERNRGMMPGEIRRKLKGIPLPRLGHVHLVLLFAHNLSLSLTDPRRFGSLSLSFRKDGSDNPFLQRLGPDYLDPHLSPEIYVNRCRCHPGLSLKSALLHQGIASGLGNIYSCESLYRARLDPRRHVKEAKDHELVQLLNAVRKNLATAIMHRGTTLRDYRDGAGRAGGMKKFLQIYGNPSATRIRQGGRTTWFHPSIQK